MSDYLTRERNLTLLTDYYEYTMINGYFHAGIQDKVAVFDVFFRRVPEDGGFAIFAGLQQIIEYINSLSFTEEDIEYFRRKGCFSEEFFDFLRNFKFCCDVWSIRDGHFPQRADHHRPRAAGAGADGGNHAAGHLQF